MLSLWLMASSTPLKKQLCSRSLRWQYFSSASLHLGLGLLDDMLLPKIIVINLSRNPAMPIFKSDPLRHQIPAPQSNSQCLLNSSPSKGINKGTVIISNLIINLHVYMNSRVRLHLKLVLALTLCLSLASAHSSTHNQRQINSRIDSTKIMYGSTVRIKAIAFNYYLHSHEVNYPQGSGYQSVTGFSMDNDYNSLWTIKEPHGDQVKTYQEQVQCGDAIRLEHALTKRNLHSEEIFQSMITKGQEISCYGNAGSGDDNDNWVIKCLSKKDGEDFYGGDNFELIHENTDKKIKMSKYYEYSYSNWENCPFQGQLEVSGTPTSTRETQFKIVGGVFFRETEKTSQQETNEQL